MAGLWLISAGLMAAPRSGAKTPVTAEALRILRDECFLCHGEEKKKGGLSLSSPDALGRGGDEGPVVVAGKPADSKLLTAVQVGAEPHMPPKKQLAESQIKALRAWITAGAQWDAAALSEAPEIPAPVPLSPLPGSYQPVMALAWAPDGRGFAIARGGQIAFQDGTVTNPTPVAPWDAHVDAIRSLAWSPDGTVLASGAYRRIRLGGPRGESSALILTNGLRGHVTALQFAPDGKTLAVGDSETGRIGWVRLIDARTGEGMASWRAHGDTVFALDFSRDGQRLVTAGGDRLIKVWTVATHEVVAVLEGHTAQVLAVAFNTNATQVVSGGVDQQLKVWDIATREKIISLGTHSAAITAVSWPGTGASVFAATEAGGVFRYTNLKSHSGEQSSATGDERSIGTLPDAVLSLSVTSNALQIVAGGHDGSVRRWNDEGKLIWEGLPVALPVAASDRQPTGKDARANPGKGGAIAEVRPATRSTKTAAKTPVVGTNLPPKTGAVVSLRAEPAELLLTPDAPRHGVLITATTVEGFEVDVTEAARFRSSATGLIRVDETGVVEALAPGRGLVRVRAAGHEVAIPVTVREAGRAVGPAAEGIPASAGTPPVSFVRDVLPALNRAGCAAGACHAKAAGQNGFKLSVFSYDTRHDYDAIVKAARGRRVFPAAPDESLLLQKALTTVPHEGGQRFERGSATHQLLVRWLREGMVYAATNEPALQRISVFPAERRYKKGSTQRLQVLAHYADGSHRDVTSLAGFAENDREIATVDEHGRMTIGKLTGQGVIVARYMGFVADSQILVPADHPLPEARYAALPRNNFIDELAFAQLRRLGLFPSDVCTDAEFIRRAKLDAVGQLPTPEEVREFLADPAPDKRGRWIARVLDNPAYADYWANKWADLVRPNSDRVGVKSVFVLDEWLRERFRANQPYDQFVREILLAEGSNHRNGPAVIYRDRREPPELTTMFSQLFLGTRLECAKCHHHPNEKWSQDDFYQMAAFFGGVKQKGAGLSPPISAGTETFYFAGGGEVKHPVSGQVMVPRPPDGPVVKPVEGVDPRGALADWLTAPENPFFARAAVNRVWATFFGRGLVEPVDDFRISNPCVNAPLLDALAQDFAAHGYDFKHLIRTLLASRLYQLSTTPNESNLADTRNFSRAYRRRLPAEVLLDAVTAVTEIPDTFAATPPGFRAMQTWSYKIGSHFLDAFGRPNASSDCPCERDRQMSVVQSLHLMNARDLQGKLEDPAGRVQRLAGSSRTPSEVVNELYLLMLSRPPAPDELTVATAAYAAPGATRASATADVFWALLNSAEFVLNH